MTKKAKDCSLHVDGTIEEGFRHPISFYLAYTA